MRRQTIRRKSTAYNKAGHLKEHYEQADFFKYVKEMKLLNPTNRRWRLIFAIPNGGKRDVVTASIMRSEGVMPGVPDVCVAVTVGRYHGLYIENKTQDHETTKGGGIKDAQNTMHEDLILEGYAVRACYNSQQMIQALEDYFAGKLDGDKKTVTALDAMTVPPRRSLTY